MTSPRRNNKPRTPVYNRFIDRMSQADPADPGGLTYVQTWDDDKPVQTLSEQARAKLVYESADGDVIEFSPCNENAKHFAKLAAVGGLKQVSREERRAKPGYHEEMAKLTREIARGA